jgi:hypothetical protein
LQPMHQPAARRTRHEAGLETRRRHEWLGPGASVARGTIAVLSDEGRVRRHLSQRRRHRYHGIDTFSRIRGARNRAALLACTITPAVWAASWPLGINLLGNEE